MKRWNYWTSYHLCLKYNPFNQFFHRFSINFHNNEKHIALKPNLRKILISRSFNKHTKNPSTIERISRGVESTFTWRGESSFDVRVKRWKRWERWMTRRERLWNEMDEGWRQASRKVLQPDSVQRGLSRHLCQLSPLRHWIERKREGVGAGAFADRKFKRSTYLIRWLNGSRTRSSFPVLLWKRLMLLQFSVAESVTNEIHESAHNPRFSFTTTRLFQTFPTDLSPPRKRISSNRRKCNNINCTRCWWSRICNMFGASIFWEINVKVERCAFIARSLNLYNC